MLQRFLVVIRRGKTDQYFKRLAPIAMLLVDTVQSWLLYMIVSICCFERVNVRAVVVDGTKNRSLLATKNQSKAAQSIDPYNTKTCGLADPNAAEHEFINMAKEGQFPWIVSFQIKVSDSDVSNTTDDNRIAKRRSARSIDNHLSGKLVEDLQFCAGSIISDKWILSAAHCFTDDKMGRYMRHKRLKVVAGSHKVSSRVPINRNLTIENIYIHPKFNKSVPVGYDIALVELRDKVRITQKRIPNEFGEQKEPFMNTICLPLRDKLYYANESARLAGWGLSRAQDVTSRPSKLLTTDIKLQDVNRCANRYAKLLNTNKPKEQKDNRNDFLCAGFGNTRDSCQSDSGGPLMQYASRKAVVIGIVSYGIGCATKGVPGLYTRVSAYMDWIKDITKNATKASVSFILLNSQGRSGGKESIRKKRTTTSTTTRPMATEKVPQKSGGS